MPTTRERRTLQKVAEKSTLKQFMEAVQGCQATANYCCGGSIPISPSTNTASNFGDATISKSPLTASPVALRWDVPKEEKLRKITFPFPPENSSGQAVSPLDDLIEACAPATFGYKGKDVLDEGYRKAGKLDSNQFSIAFHPHDYGIVDAISQLLLPEVKSSILKGREEQRGIVTELYKLNVSFSFHLFVDRRKINAMLYRSTRPQGTSSKPMLTLLEEQHSLAPWWFACLIPIKVTISVDHV